MSQCYCHGQKRLLSFLLVHPPLSLAPRASCLWLFYPTSHQPGSGCAHQVPAPSLVDVQPISEKRRCPRSGLQYLETFLLPGSRCQYAIDCHTSSQESWASGMPLHVGLNAKECSGSALRENPDTGRWPRSCHTGWNGGAEASARMDTAQGGVGSRCCGCKEHSWVALWCAPKWGRVGLPHLAYCCLGCCQA